VGFLRAAWVQQYHRTVSDTSATALSPECENYLRTQIAHR
jgi:hypothetical protein